MASINRIKENQIVYDRKRSTGLYRLQSSWQEWRVKILKIDLEKKEVLISWNGNSPYWIDEQQLKRYRLKSIYDQTAKK